MAHNRGFTYNFGFKPGTGVNREDLVDMIHNIDPWDTPFFTMAPKTKAYHVYHEWPEDTLTATSTAGAVEGADFATASNQTAPTRVVNQTQIFRKDIGVTNTQLVVNPAGINDMYRYQITKALKEIKRNVEAKVFAVLSATTATSGSSGTGRVMKGMQDFITSAKYHVTSAGVGGTASTASAQSIGETHFNGMLQVCYENGGTPMDVYCSPPVKRVISDYAGGGPTQAGVIAATDRTVVYSVDIYISDFGTQYIHVNRWVPSGIGAGDNDSAGHVFFIDRTRARIAFLRTPKHVPIASAGDSVRGIVLTELTLELLNQKGHGRLYGVKNT
jgi:hypothetical protein